MVDFTLDIIKLSNLVDIMMNGPDEGPHAFVMVIVPNIKAQIEQGIASNVHVAQASVVSNMDKDSADGLMRTIIEQGYTHDDIRKH